MTKCPICSQRLLPGADRCPSCGYRVPSGHTAPAPAAPEKPSHPPAFCFCCGAVLIPVVILLVFLIGVSFELVGEVFESPAPEPVLPMTPEAHATVPAASEDCFVLAEGVLMFRPERWDGGRVLRVPEEVGGHTVTAIGPGCFRDCDLLTTIELPDTVKLISPEAFAGCTELRGLFVPEGVGSIGEDAFAGCTALESIYIPASVDHIAKGCFDDCAGMLYIFYEGSFEHWNGLYSDYINPFTAVICIDGNYRHGVTE